MGSVAGSIFYSLQYITSSSFDCLMAVSNMRFLGAPRLCVAIVTIAFFGCVTPSSLNSDQKKIMGETEVLEFLVGKLKGGNGLERGEFGYWAQQVLDLTKSMHLAKASSIGEIGRMGEIGRWVRSRLERIVGDLRSIYQTVREPWNEDIVVEVLEHLKSLHLV